MTEVTKAAKDAAAQFLCRDDGDFAELAMLFQTYGEHIATAAQSEAEALKKLLTEKDALIHQLGENAAEAAREYADGMAALRGEVERLRKALVVLRDLPISESDSPDTLHLHGEAYTGPAVDWLFRIVRKIKQIADTALASEPGK